MRRELTPDRRRRSRKFQIISGAEAFSGGRLRFNEDKREIPGIDYDTVQFGEGLRFWVDYTNSQVRDPRVVAFLRTVAIKHALARISSLAQVKSRKRFGPYGKRVFRKCLDQLIAVPDFYSQSSVGSA